MPADQPEVTRLPALVHGALCSGLVLVIAIFWYLSGQMTPTPLPAMVIYLPLVVAAVTFLTALRLRIQLFDSASTSSAEWWKANLQRAILLWSLFEGPAFFGAVIFLVSGQWIPLVATGVGFVLLVLHSPALLRPE